MIPRLSSLAHLVRPTAWIVRALASVLLLPAGLDSNGWRRCAGRRAALAILLATACGQESPPSSQAWPGQVIEAVQEVYVDGLSADLVPIGWMSYSGSGILAVSQPQDQRILFFTPEGSRVTSLGAFGDGPGEFRRLVRAGWFADTLWVFDSDLARLTMFNAEGSLTRTASFYSYLRGTAGTLSWAVPYALRAGDTLVARAYVDSASSALALVHYDTQFVEVLASVRPSMDEPNRIVTASGAQVVAEPFQDRALFPQALAADGGERLALVRVDLLRRTYSVAVITSAGDTIFDVTHSFPGAAIPRRVADSVVEVRARQMLSVELAELYRRSAYVPPVFPPFRSVLVSGSGLVWLELEEVYGAVGHREYVILNCLGAVHGRLLVGRELTVGTLTPTGFWAVHRGPYGVQSLARFRVGALAEGCG